MPYASEHVLRRHARARDPRKPHADDGRPRFEEVNELVDGRWVPKKSITRILLATTLAGTVGEILHEGVAINDVSLQRKLLENDSLEMVQSYGGCQPEAVGVIDRRAASAGRSRERVRRENFRPESVSPSNAEYVSRWRESTDSQSCGSIAAMPTRVGNATRTVLMERRRRVPSVLEVRMSIFYKYGKVETQSDNVKFDARYHPGTETPDSGIYICVNCGKARPHFDIAIIVRS